VALGGSTPFAAPCEVRLTLLLFLSLVCFPQLLWSDPQSAPGRAPSKRGVGLSFGPDVTRSFLANNGLELLIRSHEVKEDGYEIDHGGQLITVFSAPNCKHAHTQAHNTGTLWQHTSSALAA